MSRAGRLTTNENPIHILVVEGRFYHHISDELILGAEMTLREQGATWEVMMVPGALEIPQVLALAIESGMFIKSGPAPFHGFVALGCVIRGETSHYDIVAGEFPHARSCHLQPPTAFRSEMGS